MAKQKSEVAEIITDLILIQPLNEVVANSGLEKTKAEKYALGYAPLMREVIEQSDLLKGLDKTKPEDAAKAKRISLDLGKICSRLTTKKKEDKDTLLIETRLIDGLFNVAESTARLTQKEADKIVDYLANIERERLAALADTRRAELESYGADTSYLPLDIMGDEQYARCLESAQLAFEARRITAEKLEADRLQAIKDAELAELERQRIEAERVEAERLEAIRMREELAAKEQELVKERQQRAAEAEKLAKENEAKLAQQKRLAEIESKKQAEILAKQKAETEKLAKELQAKKDAKQKELEAKRLAQLAPDKDKINALYLSLKNLAMPDFTSFECQVIGTQVLNKISHILSYIKEESKKLS
jgi:hypothetical protein